MRRLQTVIVALTLGLLPLASAGQAPVIPSRTELAPGIFLFGRPGYGDVGLDGNSIAILSRVMPARSATAICRRSSRAISAATSS